MLSAEKRYHEEIGRRLRQFRLAASKSQETAGKHVGCTFQQIQKYERGINRTPLNRLEQLAEFYGVPMASFFIKDEMEATTAPVPVLPKDVSSMFSLFPRLEKRQRRLITLLVKEMLVENVAGAQ